MTQLHHVVDGPQQAPVLVLGPSLGTDLGLFDAQVAALADRWRVVRYDLPGHGGSAASEGPYTMADLAEDVLAVLDHLGVERFHYAGVSLGGAIGQWLAIGSAERVLSLAVCASAACFPNRESYADRAAQARAEGTESLLASREGTWYTQQFAAERPDEAERLLTMLRDTEPEGYAGCCEAISTFDVRPELSRVTAATLVVAGSEDPATPVEIVREIADGIPGARFVEVSGAAHLVNVERADVVNEALAGHLARVSS
jgi:3-oxoadipate enol-lactonase